MIKINKLKKIFNIFWTGGFDSTFLIIYFLKFAKKSVKIQPIYFTYLINEKRKNIKKEIETMDIIRTKLNIEYENRLLETIYIDDIIIDDDIKTKALKFYENFDNQYVVIAQICKNLGIQGVVGINYDDKQWRKYEIKNKNSSESVFHKNNLLKNYYTQLFSNFRLPIIQISKEQMLDFAKQNNFYDILQMTWSCWNPQINDTQPCLKCKMCKQRII